MNEIKKMVNYDQKIIVDFRNGKVDRYSVGNYKWLPTLNCCFYCGNEAEVGSDYDIYELTTRYSNYESSSGRYYKFDEKKLWIICSEYDCQTSIRDKSPIELEYTPQGGKPVTRVLATKLIDGIANRKLEKSAEKLEEERIEREKKEKEREYKKNNWKEVSFIKIENEIWAKRVQNCQNGIVTTQILVPTPKRKDKVELVEKFLQEKKIDKVIEKKEWDNLSTWN